MTVSLRERFEAKTCPEPNSGCLLWMGYVEPSGYGIFSANGSNEYAHRSAWSLAHGSLPAPPQCVLHKCDVRCCVNVGHLFIGTKGDNSADMAAKQRSRRSACGLPFGAQPQWNGTFASRIRHRNIRYYLGTYKTAEEASSIATARKAALLLEDACRR